MRKIRNKLTGKVEAVRLDPGEKQYLASLNLRNIAPEAWAEVKRRGAERWRKNRKTAIDHLSNDDSITGPWQNASMNRST